MNNHDMLMLLAYLNELDGRHSPNEVKVRAWVDVLNEGAADMPLEFARETARKHYALLGDMLTPATLIRAWKQQQRSREIAMMGDTSEAHCRRSECRCTHTGVCYRGWLDNDRGVAVPCRVCRGSLADVLDRIPELGSRSEHDHALIRNRFTGAGRGDYE